MSVAPVNGQEITRSNAYNFYYGHYHNKYQLTEEQLERCEEFLTQDQIEYCQKDSGDFVKAGSDSIDTEGMGDGKGRGGTDSDNKAATIAGTAASAISVGAIAIALLLGGFSQLAISLVCTAAAAINVAAAFAMDGAYDKREKQNEANATNEQKIQEYDAQVKEATEELKAAQAHYIEVQNQKTAMVTDATNNRALQEVELHDAQVAGDENKANQIQQQLDNNKDGPDTSAQDTELDAARMQVETANEKGLEAGGANDTAFTVAGFLQEGKGFVPFTKVQKYLNMALAGACSLCVLGTMPKIAPIFPDGPACLAGKVWFAAAGAAFTFAGNKFSDKASKEEGFGTNGDSLNKNCNTLGESITTLNSEIDNTNGIFTQTDEAAAETIVATEESAEASTNENNGTHPTVTVTQEPEVEEEPEDLVL